MKPKVQKGPPWASCRPSPNHSLVRLSDLRSQDGATVSQRASAGLSRQQ